MYSGLFENFMLFLIVVCFVFELVTHLTQGLALYQKAQNKTIGDDLV